ncbi:MAG: hypothetical protein Q8K02_09000 [Flavobacterium sp.]|nr:hypothetical protein [Flavobacterium sp.]
MLKDNIKIIAVAFFSTFLYFAPVFLKYIIPLNYFSGIIGFCYFISLVATHIALTIIGILALSFVIYKATQKQKQGKIVLFIAASFCSMVLLTSQNILLKKIILGDLPVGSNLLKFDTNKWKGNSSLDTTNDISRRGMMLKDVVQNVLPGKNKKEIEELLGPSLETNYFKDVEKDMIYFLDTERTSIFNIDSEWLLIWLDKNGKFDGYKIVND